MRFLLKCILLCLCAFPSFAQEKKVSGSIRSTGNQAVPYANIIVSDTSHPQSPVSFVSSDRQGAFVLQLPLSANNLLINVTAIGYTEKTILVSLDTLREITIYLDTSTTQLKEIVVKARPASDTLNLGIDSMNLSKDASLRDILNKTDGVIVGKDGGISFQGKQINKVLINGKEVFVGQNKVALDNLNYEIMDNVQIITNYKDKFTIDFNRVQDPVINIKTKSTFTGVVKSQFNLGYGFKNSYSLNGKGFFFSERLNAFATSHTNNTGEKELSQKDVVATVNEQASDWLSTTLSPVFTQDYQMRKNFVSNSSLTLRRQGDKSKSGLVFYHGKIRTERETDYNTSIADTRIKNSRQQQKDNTSFVSATASVSYLLSPKTVLQNVTTALLMRQRQYRESEDTQFVPSVTRFLEQTGREPTTFVLANTLKLTTLLNNRTAVDISLHYYREKDSMNFDTRLTNDNTSDIFQQGNFSKEYLSANGNIRYRSGTSSALNAGISLTKSNEYGRLAYQPFMKEGSLLKRHVTTLAVPLSFQGSANKLDYSFSVTPVLINISSSGNKGFLKTSNLLTYNFKEQNNLILGLSRKYGFTGLHTLFDTVIQTYNYKTINAVSNINELTTREEVSLSWFNTNVARSKSMYFTYKSNRESNFLQSVFDSVSANVFYYSSRLFNRKNTHTLNTGFRKGFYFEPVYNRLDISGGFTYTAGSYTTIISNKEVPARSVLWEPVVVVGFALRHSWIKEITGRVQWSNLAFNIDHQNANRQSTVANTLTIEAGRKKIEGKLDVAYLFYNVNKRRLNVPDCSFSLKYYLSEKLAFSTAARSMLTLFRLNNYTFINTLSDGNTVTQIATNNNLGYLLFYVTLKL